MKICAYCTTKNRDEAIFCSHCRRPLPGRSIPRDTSLLRFLAILVLIGLGSYLFLSGSSLAAAPGTPTSPVTPTPEAAYSQRHEYITLYTCVEYETKVRRGPSTQTETVGGLPSGTCITVIGRTEDASWVYMIGDNHQTGWVSVSALRHIGGLGKVSVRDSTALASAARPTLTSAEIAFGAQAYLTKVAATNLPNAPLSPYTMPCLEAANRVGDFVSCKLERAYCDYLPDVNGSPTFCNDRPHPDHNFALVVFGEDWSDYDGKCLVVQGYLEISQGVLEIQALRRDQVSTCE